MKYLTITLLFLVSACINFRTSKLTIINKSDFYHGKSVNADSKIGIMPFYIRQWRVSYNKDLLIQMKELIKKMNVYLQQKKYIKFPTIKLDVFSYPDAYFGVAESIDFPGDQENPEFASYDKTEKPIMTIYQESPSKKWVDSLKIYCKRERANYVLVPYLSIGNFKVYQKDWSGNKEIKLGTNYKIPVPWLTALDQPVEVLYIGASLVNSNGEIIKVGAEGLWAKKTKLLLSSMNIQSSITFYDVRNVLKAKRKDLQGQPLIWKVAIDNLLKNMSK